MNDETFFRMMQDNNPEMFNYVRETINAGLRKGYSNQTPEDNFMSMKGEAE